jgi:phage terminase large subunit
MSEKYHRFGAPSPRATVQEISTGYVPRPLQADLHGMLKRFNVIVCHRRFGKTVFSINELTDQALRNTRSNPQYAYIAPTYGQAERIAWDMLKSYTKDIPGVIYNESKLTCTIPRPDKNDRIKIYLLGAENPDSIRGMYLDGVILDEFAEMDPRVWGQVVRPALADRKGWAIFIGTPKGENHFYDVYKTALKNLGKGWFACVHKASNSGVLPIEEIDAMRAEMTEDEYEQEMECSFTAALTGAYWGRQMRDAEEQHRIVNVPHDASLLVDTVWDLGVNDTTAIWFVQQYRNEIRIIDYLEMAGQGLEYYAKALKGQGDGNTHRQDYVYREHHWPHDGKARDLSTGKSRQETMRNFGIRVKVHERYNVADGIQAARQILKRCWFDIKRCGDRGIMTLKSYTKRWDGKNKIWLDEPLHNWASNGADAFRLLAMALRPGEDRLAEKKNLPRQTISAYDIINHR